MAIIFTVDQYSFANQFEAQGRLDSYSRIGLEKLFNHLDELSEDTGTNIELDVIAICCDYNESSIDDVINDYRIELDLSDCETLDETNDAKAEQVREFLSENTMLIDDYELNGKTNFLFQVF